MTIQFLVLQGIFSFYFIADVGSVDIFLCPALTAAEIT